MRLAAISDIHGNLAAFEAIVRDLRRQSPDCIVCLGDITMRGPQPLECVQLLHSLNPLLTVRGNYDNMFTRWPWHWFNPDDYKHQLAKRAFDFDCAHLSAADQAWLANLPTSQVLSLDGLQTEFFHASPWDLFTITTPWAPLDELARLRIHEESGLVVFGHVHHAFARQARGRQVVNPGSVGTPFDGDNRASYAIIDIEGGALAVQIRRVPYDIEAAIAVGRERAMPDLDSFAYGLRTARYPYAGPVS